MASTFLYVGNLGMLTTETMVRDAFTAAGKPVKSVVILRTPQNGRSRGFGFVELDSEGEALEVTRSMNGVEIEGKPIKVGPAKERTSPRSPGFNFQTGNGSGPRRPGGARRPGGGAKRKSR